MSENIEPSAMQFREAEIIDHAAAAKLLAQRDHYYAENKRLREWQLIETAPMNNTDILGYGPHETKGHYIGDVHWWNGYWTITLMSGYGAPTHWMPLPEPPISLNGQSECHVCDGVVLTPKFSEMFPCPKCGSTGKPKISVSAQSKGSDNEN